MEHSHNGLTQHCITSPEYSNHSLLCFVYLILNWISKTISSICTLLSAGKHFAIILELNSSQVIVRQEL